MRRASRIALQRHEASHLLDRGAEANASRIGACMPEPRHRYVDDLRIEFLQVFVAQAVIHRHSRRPIFDEHVRSGYDFLQRRQPFRLFNVQGEALFPSVVFVEIARKVDFRGSLSAARGPNRVWERRAFHLDYLGTHISEEPSTVRPRPDLSHVDNPDSSQGQLKFLC